MLGPKGSTINEILQLTGVSVEMPSADSTIGTITLRGPQETLGIGENIFYFTYIVFISIFFMNIYCSVISHSSIMYDFFYNY